jgi:hypothetical protein
VPTSEIKPGHILIAVEANGRTRKIDATTSRLDIEKLLSDVKAELVKLYTMPDPARAKLSPLALIPIGPPPAFRYLDEPLSIEMRVSSVKLEYRPPIFVDIETDSERRLRRIEDPRSGCPLVFPLVAETWSPFQ